MFFLVWKIGVGKEGAEEIRRILALLAGKRLQKDMLVFRREHEFLLLRLKKNGNITKGRREVIFECEME